MNYIVELLAKLFATFKLKNPMLASVVLLVLGAVSYTAQQGTFLGLFVLPEWATPALSFVALFLTAVTGSQTYQYLNNPKASTAKS